MFASVHVTRHRYRSRNDFLAGGVAAQLFNDRTQRRSETASGGQREILFVGRQGFLVLLLFFVSGSQQLIDHWLRVGELRNRLLIFRNRFIQLTVFFVKTSKAHMGFRLRTSSFANRAAKRSDGFVLKGAFTMDASFNC